MFYQGRFHGAKAKLIAGLAFSVSMTGCLEIKGITDVKPEDLNNSNFSVSTPDGSEGQTSSSGRPISTGDSSSSSGSGSSSSSDDGSGSVETQVPEGFVINNGALYSKSSSLTLSLYPPFTSAYYSVSENSECSSSNWIEYGADTVGFQTTQVNKAANLSVQFKDHDGRVSLCFKNSIVVDNLGPQIVFQKYPNSLVEEGTDVELVFSVEDTVGVQSVSCEFAGILKTCFIGTNKLTIPKMAEGSYTLKVSAEDKLGNKSAKSISFEVSSSYRKLKQTVAVTQNNKVDILFVIDNSGSMAYEQKSMASRVKNFLDVVKGLDWQAAVTTTDPSSSTYGDGRLVAMKGLTNTYILTSAMDDATARTVLSNTLQRSETGSGLEQGILATYRLLERSQSGAAVYKDFIRPGAQLAVVEISDEDESANGVKNDPQSLLNFIQSSYGGQKAFSFHSIIARPGDSKCLSGEGAAAGYRLEQMSKLTGGIVGDVCAADYAAQMIGIADGVRKTLKTITLSCEPIVDSTKTIVVLKDGVVYNGTYTKSGVNIVFDQMLPAGSYDVIYSCLK